MSKFRNKPYRNVGDPSSKYGFDKDGKQFERDIQANLQRWEKDYASLIEFAKKQGLTPDRLRHLLHRLIDEFDL